MEFGTGVNQPHPVVGLLEVRGPQRVDRVVGDVDALESAPYAVWVAGVGCDDVEMVGPRPIVQALRMPRHDPDAMATRRASSSGTRRPLL
jgi:hypothetical protein